jgi:carboxypeptidase C (cathepsin A)
MQYLPNRKALLALMLGAALTAWGQGGGRAGRNGAAQQAGAPAANPQAGAANAGGRGTAGGAGAAAPAAGGGAGEFFNFDTTANGMPPIADGPPAETHQKITVNGEALAYTAHAGFLPLRNATTSQSEAHIFYTSYSKEGVTDPATRPVVFFLSGAPGVAAAWQEFGGLGPKRMKWAADGSAGSAPYTWSDNPNTLLGQADLVFVNPVGTAFSRPDVPSRGPTFWNTAADIASLAEFVRSFVNANNRRNSPLFLAGEDAGTARVSGLAAYLNEHLIPVRGVMLLSMTSTADATAGDEQYMTLFPSLVMASWYHKKLSPELNAMSAEQISGQARQFASREYLHALYKGDRMSAEERTKVIADIARLTGLSKTFIVNNELRITADRFNTELMHDQHRGLSMTDDRVTGFIPNAGGGGRGGGGGGGFGLGGGAGAVDFNLSNLAGGFETAYETYLRRELTFNANTGLFYLNTGGVSGFTGTGNDDANLAGAFARNPNLRLFIAMNYFDLSAPFYASEFTFAHLNVSPEVRAHITVKNYESGQMTYVDSKALGKLQADLAHFVTDATGAPK